MREQDKEGTYTFREILNIIRWRTREYKLNKYQTYGYYLDFKRYKKGDNYRINLVITDGESGGNSPERGVVTSSTRGVYILKDITPEELEEQIEVGKEWEVIEELIKESEIYLRKTKTNPRSVEALRAKYIKFETKKI